MLLKKTLFVAFRQIVAMAMGFGSSLLFARNLGADGNGEFVAVCVMVAALVSLTSLGSGNFPNFAVGRLSDADLQRNMFGVAALCTALATPLVLGICFWKSWSVLVHAPVLLLVLFVGFYNQAGLSFLQARGDLRGYNFAILGGPIFLLLAACLTLVYPFVHVALGGFVLGELMAFALALRYVNKHKEIYSPGHTKFLDYVNQAVKYGWKVQIILFYTLLLYRGVLFIIDKKMSLKEVGVFAVALTIVEKSGVLSQAISIASFNQMKDGHKMNAGQLDRLAWRSFVLTFIAGLVLAGICELIVVKILGSDYEKVAVLVLLLVPGIAAFGAGRLYLNYFFANDRLDGLLFGLIVILFGSLSLILLLMSYFHLYGVALGVSAAFIVVSAYLKIKRSVK